MINAKLITQDATLNNFAERGTISYTPGENLVISFRLYQRDNIDLRYIPVNPAAIVSAVLIDIDGNEIVKVASEIDALDRSMYKFTLSQAETESLSGSNLKIILDLAGDETILYMTVIQNVLLRTLLSGECC